MVLLLLHRFALQNCDLHGIFVLRTLHYQIQSSFYPVVTSLRNHWVLLLFPHVTPQHLFLSLVFFFVTCSDSISASFFIKKIFKKTITKSLKGSRLVQQNIATLHWRLPISTNLTSIVSQNEKTNLNLVIPVHHYDKITWTLHSNIIKHALHLRHKQIFWSKSLKMSCTYSLLLT